MTTHTTYKVPKGFIKDHAKRNCLRTDGFNEGSAAVALTSIIMKETKQHFFIALTDAQVKELMSDADYYTHGSDQPDIGLRSSARATLKALIAQSQNAGA